jgi:hypothetical protein
MPCARGHGALELELAWKVLRDGGVIFGDDWKMPVVESDVKAFLSAHCRLPSLLAGAPPRDFACCNVSEPVPGLLLSTPKHPDKLAAIGFNHTSGVDRQGTGSDIWVIYKPTGISHHRWVTAGAGAACLLGA